MKIVMGTRSRVQKRAPNPTDKEAWLMSISTAGIVAGISSGNPVTLVNGPTSVPGIHRY